jgi:hypothetical protein
MRLEQYQLNANEDLMAFEFVSERPKGRIIKQIQFLNIGTGIYNLAFGDKKENDFDDEVITDNKDSQKVLATVAASVLIFSEKHPEVWIHAKGGSKSRTRLYRIGISQNLNELEQHFHIIGLYKGNWIKFEKI